MAFLDVLQGITGAFGQVSKGIVDIKTAGRSSTSSYNPAARPAVPGSIFGPPLIPGGVPTAVGASSAMVPMPLDPVVGGQGFGEKFVSLAGRALSAYEQSRARPNRFEVAETTNADDRELLKLLYARGAVPRDSDLGEYFESRGARPIKMRVKFSDGSSEVIEVFRVKGGRGGGRRVNYAAPAKIRDAARTFNAAGRVLRTLTKLERARGALRRLAHPVRHAMPVRHGRRK